MKDCTTETDFQELLLQSDRLPQFLLKHSTRCGVSRKAHDEYARFDQAAPSAGRWRVLVVEQRDLSLKIADLTGVRHESPQVILFSRGKPVWSTTHYMVTTENLEEALAKHT